MVPLNGDVVLYILEAFLEDNGSWRNIHILLMNKQLTKKLYPAFYRNITLFNADSLKALNRTLIRYPPRIRHIRSLLIVIDRHPIKCSRNIIDSTYPANYFPGRYYHPNYIGERDIWRICTLLRRVSELLRKLTLVSRVRLAKLERLFGAIYFPNLRELRVPIELVLPVQQRVHNSALQFPALTHLCVILNKHKRAVQSLIFRQHFDIFASLTHLAISYDYFSLRDVHRGAKDIRVAKSVRAIALQNCGGGMLPFKAHRVVDYEVNPRVVFLARGDGPGLLEIEDLMKDSVVYQELMDMTLFMDNTRTRKEPLWNQVEEKVASRWCSFHRLVFPEHKQIILGSPSLFVPVDMLGN